MLKRKHARLCMVLMALSLLLIAFTVLMYGVAQSDSPLWGILGLGGFAACTVSHLLVKLQYLKCPACGKAWALPQWKAGKRYYCVRCGEPFVYDDEAEN